MQREKYSNIISNSPKMDAIFSIIDKVAPTKTNVLIQGESGTGKELIAKAIHINSSRSKGPFIAINCACIPNELLESEFFGYEKGAFTGASSRTLGKFEAASGGTLFLDEIATLPIQLQAKLLRVLQEKEITRLGSNNPISVDVRVVAASNEHLDDMVKANTFRPDLYYRLSVVPIELPPLRQRGNDIVLLLSYFLNKFNTNYGKSILGFTHSALECIKKYRWAGNVRELEHFVERMVVLGSNDSYIAFINLPTKMFMASQNVNNAKDVNSLDDSVGLEEARKIFESEFISKRLQMYNWNQMETARNLKIHRNTLIHKMKNLNISRPKTAFSIG